MNKKTEITFNEEQVGLIRRLIAPKATTEELQLFLYVCRKTGLDPLSKQIYCIHRKGKMTIQTGIDGYRVIAQRSTLYAGQSEPTYGEDKDGHPTWAKVCVYKFGPNEERYEASVGLAYWDEYVPPPGYDQDIMWKKMPHNQLAKVAEALALRKAFPQDLSGIYTDLEMEQSEPTITTDKSADELKKDYLKLLEQFRVYRGDEAADRIHPDNWKVEQTIDNFVLAIQSLQEKIEYQKSLNPNQT